MYRGVVAANHYEMERFWNHWVQECEADHMDPFLSSLSTKEQVSTLAVFGHKVRTGQFPIALASE